MDYKSIHSNLINTLCYSDIFEFPLTLDELWRYYNGNSSISKDVILKVLKKSSQIQKKDQYYFLPEREWVVEVRKKREQESEIKLKKAYIVAHILSIIPTIKLIGISGSLSVKNALKDDDIDLFVITRKNTLWFTRLMVNLVLLFLLQKRKRLSSLAKNKICPNMFIAEDYLSLSKKKNIYIAREILQLKVLVSKGLTYEKFLSSNKWVRKFFPNMKRTQATQTKKANSVIDNLWKAIDLLCFHLQLRYMSSRRTTEIVEKNIAEFHPNNREKFILKEYSKRVNYFSKEVIKRVVFFEHETVVIQSLKHNYVPIVLASN